MHVLTKCPGRAVKLACITTLQVVGEVLVPTDCQKLFYNTGQSSEINDRSESLFGHEALDKLIKKIISRSKADKKKVQIKL